MKHFRAVSGFAVLALLLVALVPGQAAKATSVAAPAQVPPPPSKTQAPGSIDYTIDCTNSPFGRKFVVGQVNQEFLSYTDGSGLLHADRLNLDPQGQLFVEKPWTSPDSALSTNNRVGAVMVDRDADERLDFVQALQTTNDQYTLVAHLAISDTKTPDYSVKTVNGPRSRDNFAVATGNIFHSNQATPGSTIVASIRRGPGGSNQAPNYVDVRLPYGTLFWQNQSSDLLDAADVQLAVGDLELSGFKDDIVLAVLPKTRDRIELFVLKSVPGYTGDGASIQANGLQAVAHSTISNSSGSILAVRLATGQTSKHYQDEVTVAWSEDQPDNPGLAAQINVKTTDYVTATKALQVRNSWIKNDNLVGKSLGLAVGDIQRQGFAEIAVGYMNFYGGSGKLAIHTLKATGTTIENVPGGYWESNPTTDPVNYSTPHSLSLAVGDLNGDGWAEIVAAYRPDDTHFRTLYLNRTPPTGTDPQAPPTDLTLRSQLAHAGTANWLQVQLGDFYNQSLKAQYGAAVQVPCARVTEPHLSSVVYAPPFWQNIQQRAGDGQYVYGSIGESHDRQQSSGSTVTNRTSDSFSASYGLDISSDFVDASLKATFGYELESSVSSGSTTDKSQTTSQGWQNSSGPFVVFQGTVYDCYSYKLTKGGNILDSEIHACQPKTSAELSANLDTWDTQYSAVTDPNALEYTPVAPDWSSLTAFRGGQTAQSSTAGNATADHAVDLNTDGVLADGSASSTNQEAHPWWQVDLGNIQPISKIRLWNRTDTTCGGPCGALLNNFRVFVSDADFRALSNDPDVLKNDSRVKTWEFSGPAGAVTSIVTQGGNQPITGRFVRVQLLGTGTLSLGEVQVYGPNHVEPIRYPRAVRDTTPGDGVFEVELFNPYTKTWQWVRQRGNLISTSADWQNWKEILIGPGQSLSYWSYQNASGGSFDIATTLATTTKVGVELEAAGGFIAKVAVGGGYEHSSGIETETTVSHAWNNSVEFGGGVTGFPSTLSNEPPNTIVTWDQNCDYAYRPYVYEVSDQSNTGFTHRYMAVDYTVPDSLDRTKDLNACLRGEYNDGTNHRPVAQNVSTNALKNGSITIDVLANDTDPDGNQLSILQVSGAAHGTAEIAGNKIVYTPYPGYTGADTFSYTITDGALTADGTVTVNVATTLPSPTATATTPAGGTATPTATKPSGGPTATPTTIPVGGPFHVYLPGVGR